MAKKAPTNNPKRTARSLEERIEDQKRKLKELQLKQALETATNAKEIKILMKAVRILRDTGEDEVAEGVGAVIAEMCDITDGDDDDTSD